MAGSATKGTVPKKTAPSPKADENSVTMGPTGRPYHGFATPPKLNGHGPARIISLCNQKGGVGKTTTTINLAAALAEYGRRVLAVDFDPQGALSAGLGVPTHDVPTIYDLLLRHQADPREVIVATAVEGLDIIPANIDLSAAEVHLVNEVARETILARVLRKVSADYDVILIDCQPSLGLLTVNALTASHGVLIPLECEFFALRGVALLIETIDKVRDRLNPAIELDGILATMYDSRTLHSREVLERVVEAFGDDVLETVIGRTVKFPDAIVVGHADHRVRARARGRPGIPAAGAGTDRAWRCRLTIRTPSPDGRSRSRKGSGLARRLRRPVRPAADAAIASTNSTSPRSRSAGSRTSSSPTCASSTSTRSSSRPPSSSSSPRPCST